MANFYAQYPASAAGSNASVGPNNTPAPSSSTQVGGVGPDGNLHPVVTDNQGHLVVDSTTQGGATAANQVLEIAQLTGIHSDTTSLDGKTVHVDTGNVTVVASALPTGASTLAAQTTGNASLASIDTKLTSPLAVTGPLTNAQLRATPVPVDGSGSTQPVSGTVTVTQATGTNLHAVIDSSALPSGAATSANQATEIASLASIDSKLTSPLAVTGPLTDTQLRASAVPVSLASTTVTGNVTVVQPTGTNLHTVVDSSALPTGAATASNQATEIASLASIDSKLTSPLVVQGSKSTTSSITSVSGSASSVSLLASNANRKGAAFYNDSSAILYLKLGATASTTSYTVQLVAGAYYEIPFITPYTGAIDGIWASAAGAVRITELT